ncbi:MAG: crossover junction endodeoxyribonuclease RuvC [Gammaproteobacteria bacterium]
MPRYRTRSWRAFDPDAAASAGTVAGGVPRATPVARLVQLARVRILGLDPGSRRTGYAVVECGGQNSKQITHGCIAAAGSTLSERLRFIFEAVTALIDQYQPNEVAVERVFVNKNVDSALKLGHARGAALCAVPATTPVFEYAPRAIKLAVVGFGAAEKAQVAHMVRTLLSVEGRITADAADALAVAVCHAHSRHALAIAESLAVRVAVRTVAPSRAR